MILAFFRARAERKAAVAKEASRLIEQFKERAYFEARERVFGRCIDGGHPASYWTAVKLEIARRQNIPIGLDGADSRCASQFARLAKEKVRLPNLEPENFEGNLQLRKSILRFLSAK